MLTQAAEAPIIDDREVVSRICAGEGELYSIIYERYYSKTYGLAYAMCGYREQAEDLTQEIFIRVFERLETYRADASFATWYYRIALNHCLNYCRRKSLHNRFVHSSGDSSIHHHLVQVSGSEFAERTMLKREIQDRIRRALLSLKPQLRALVVLRDIEGFTYAEIAEQLQCSAGSVASRLNRARKLLAKKLEGIKKDI